MAQTSRMTTSRIVLPGRPVTFARPVPHDGGAHSEARYAGWKTKAAGLINLTRRGVTYDGPVHAEVYVYADGVVLAVTGSTPDVRPSAVTGDLDNYVKAALDAAQAGHLITNDRQVQRVTAYFIKDEEFPA
jgi:Holliday junction resolvase RusA-like endonuclease